MNAFFKLSLFLLGIYICRAIPQRVSNSSHPRPGLGSSSRSNDGWSSNVNRTSGHSGIRVVYPSLDVSFKPDPVGTRQGPSMDHPKPPSCHHKDARFCNADNYPTEYMDRVAKKSSKLFDFQFNQDPKSEESDGLDRRQGEVAGEQPLCLSVEETEPQNSVRDSNDVLRWVLNHGNYTQTIRRVKCSSPDSPCQFGENFPPSYVVTCRQKYVNRKLAALNDNNEIDWLFFPIPSCCVCTYTLKRNGR